MRKLILSAAIVFFSIAAKAQNTDVLNKLVTEAKVLIEKKSFVGAQTKISQVEKELIKLKTTNSGFNTANLESEIKILKER